MRASLTRSRLAASCQEIKLGSSRTHTAQLSKTACVAPSCTEGIPRIWRKETPLPYIYGYVGERASTYEMKAWLAAAAIT